MEDKDKIAIMMEEYKSLRAELLQRNTALNSIFTVGGTVGAGAIAVMAQYGLAAAPGAGTVILLLCCLVAFAWYVIDRGARIASEHLSGLEADINHRADNQTLLSWETKHGLPREGYPFFRRPRASAQGTHIENGRQPPTS